MNDSVLQQLVLAVNTILDPNSTSGQRSSAHSICESCKENDLAGQIGFAIASNNSLEAPVKQFGLQLMQHFIINKWTQIGQEIKIQLQHNAMTLLEKCQIDECCYVKDGISHVLTEIAKHVWPQQWPTMISDLIVKAKLGPVQTELVELIFLRIAEDVAVLQNISAAHRSKDIRHGLSLKLKEIIFFFHDVLEKSTTAYSQLLGTSNTQELAELKLYYSLCCSSLKALQGYIEWINLDHIFFENGALIKLLCGLLDVDELKGYSAEVLLLLAGRKGKPESQYLFQLTSTEYTNDMLKSIQKAAARASTDEDQYLFLKSMGTLFGALATQLIAVWSEKNTDKPIITDLSSRSVFLDIMLAFLDHDNHVIVSTVSPAWASLLKHRGLCKDPTLSKLIPRIFEIAATRIRRDVKVLLPVYAQLDFNDDEEMEQFVLSSRVSLISLIKWCANSMPAHCMGVTLQWLKNELSNPLDFGVDDKGAKIAQCTKSSPTYTRWQALSSTLQMVLSSAKTLVVDGFDKSKLYFDETEMIMSSLIKLDTSDCLLCLCQLDFLNAFLPVVEFMKSRKVMVIECFNLCIKFIKMVKIHPDKWAPLPKSVRRYSLNAIVHICKHFPALVMEVNDEFKRMMMEMVNPDMQILTPLERVQIFESLVLVSGEWNSFTNQSELIGEIMKISHSMWPDKDGEYVKSPVHFARMIGLFSPPSEYQAPSHYDFRANVSFCILLTMGMMNRARVPQDPTIAKEGGFLDPEGNVKNPAAQHLLPVLEHIVLFTNMLQGLWTDVVKKQVNEEMVASLNIRMSERASLLSANPASAKDSDEKVERFSWSQMQNFIILNLENCYQILGGIGICAPEIYTSRDLFPAVLTRVFADVHSLPELRLRSFIRQFLFNFLKNCPQSSHGSVTVAVLLKYCQFMNSMLGERWNNYGMQEQNRLKVIETDLGQTNENEECEREEDEIVKEQMLRVISREYLEMLVNLCVIKQPKSKKERANLENQPTEDESQDIPMANPSTPNVSQLTELGVLLLESEAAEMLLSSSLLSISWHDTQTTFKGVQLIWPILKNSIVNSSSIPQEGARVLFESLLRGLQRHGQHEGTQAQLLALNLFTFMQLRPTHPFLVTMLASLPGVQQKAVEDFDANYKKYSEKKRKLAFKKLVEVIIEKHVGQRFKVRHHMQVLPRIFKMKKKFKKCDDLDAGNLGLEFFFKPDP